MMYFTRMEMGQNANTGLAQIVAEELNIEIDDIEGVLPNTSDVPPIALTAGSMSCSFLARRQWPATLRENLRAARQKFDVAPGCAGRYGRFQTGSKS